jgi:ABC-type polysaccharide/polyol phosphate transport system ATPase subunit
MSSVPVVSVSHVSKKYARSMRRSLWYGLADIAGELVPRARSHATLRRGEFWSLDDVSFDLQRGTALAIAGANGAGKSTLLKIVYGLLKPDRGSVSVRGNVQAMIELGTGLNPLLTGRENIRAGAALHGFDRRAAGQLLERVSDFAELGDFLDIPFQSYSTGMKARLSFALTFHLDPDVLLVDEVLAVGDFAFQRKCLSHLLAWIGRGGALLFVSHNIFQMQAVCERGILLEHGRVSFTGSAVDTISALLDTQPAAPRPAVSTPDDLREVLVIDAVRTEATNGSMSSHPETAGGGDDGQSAAEATAVTGAPLRIIVHYQAASSMRVLWGFTIWNADQSVCVTGDVHMEAQSIDAGAGMLSCLIPRLPLLGGRYAVRAAILDAETLVPLALFGYWGPATVLLVSSRPSLLNNGKMAVNQLVTIDVDWNG